MSKQTIDLLEFAELAIEKFIAQAAPAGFSLAQQEITATYVLLTFVHENRYFIVKADCYPNNNFFNVLLGEGEPEWPDAEWKTVALWKVQQFVTSQQAASEYKLKHASEVGITLNRAVNDLQQYAFDFLQGDLSVIRELLQAQASEERSFTLSQKDKKGVLQKLLEKQQLAEQLSGNENPL